MTCKLFTVLVCLGAVSMARAHVGSPNVFFEGQAGPYQILSVIRPPIALPGILQVDVRAIDADVRGVSLLPVMWPADRQASPAPVQAQRVEGETNLWVAEVWLLRPGSYTVRIHVQGLRGPGETTVPVNVLGLRGDPMGRWLKGTLLALGCLLMAGGILIASAIAKEGALATSELPSEVNVRRARAAGTVAALLFSAGVVTGAVRWRNMDRSYSSRGVQGPGKVDVSIRTDSDRRLLEVRRSSADMGSSIWPSLMPDHGKLMHLFLIREPKLDAFAHLHPLRADAGTFLLELPPLPEGNYQLYGEITYENGINQTLLGRAALPPPGRRVETEPLATNSFGEVLCGMPANRAEQSAWLERNGPNYWRPAREIVALSASQVHRDVDDSWLIEGAEPTNLVETDIGNRSLQGSPCSRLSDGYTLVFENLADVEAGRATSLRFTAFGPDGSKAPIQPYMGMLGHAAVRRVDGSVFAHLHPMGSYSMASQDVFREYDRLENGTMASPSAADPLQKGRVSFPYEFPKDGDYRLWIQVRIAGRIMTGRFDAVIASSSIKPS